MSHASDLPAYIGCRVEVAPSGCWLWTGNQNGRGYGYLYVRGSHAAGQERRRVSHRVVYEILIGDVPEGLELDHLCRVRLCCNPSHLEPVTRAENVRRGDAPDAVRRLYAAQTHCVNGHEFTPANTRQRPTGGRACRQCGRDRRAAWTPEQREAELAKGRVRAQRNRDRKKVAA